MMEMFDHTIYTECPAESDIEIPDNDKMKLLETETGELVYGRSMQLFTNTSRIFEKIFEDISFHDCKPWMKLDICIYFVVVFVCLLKM